jgi:hypothetical protein
MTGKLKSNKSTTVTRGITIRLYVLTNLTNFSDFLLTKKATIPIKKARNE